MSDDGKRIRCRVSWDDSLVLTSREAVLTVEEAVADSVYGWIGPGGRVNIPARSIQAQPFEVTFDAYVMTAQPNIRFVCHADSYNGGAIATPWRITIGNSGNVLCSVANALGVFETIGSENAIPEEEWVSVRAGHNGTHVYLEVNGEYSETSSIGMSTEFEGSNIKPYRILDSNTDRNAHQIKNVRIKEDNNNFEVLYLCNEGSGTVAINALGDTAWNGVVTDESLHQDPIEGEAPPPQLDDWDANISIESLGALLHGFILGSQLGDLDIREGIEALYSDQADNIVLQEVSGTEPSALDPRYVIAGGNTYELERDGGGISWRAKIPELATWLRDNNDTTQPITIQYARDPE